MGTMQTSKSRGTEAYFNFMSAVHIGAIYQS